MFFAINVALITYHKLNKSAPDGDAAAFEAAEPKSLGEQVGSFFAAVKAFLAGSPEIGGFLAGIVVLVLYKTLLLEKPAPAAADGPAAPAPAPQAAGQPEEEQVSSCRAAVARVTPEGGQTNLGSRCGFFSACTRPRAAQCARSPCLLRDCGVARHLANQASPGAQLLLSGFRARARL